jgi:REP element-mobilizing transposase RayT
MARPLRIHYPGAVYHITCRGNARQDIYKDNKDRKAFLEILTESQKIGIGVRSTVFRIMLNG